MSQTGNPDPGESSASANLNASVASFTSRVKDDKPITIKLDNIQKLTGQGNYNIWAASMKLVRRGMKTYEIVVDGATPADDADASEKTAYESLCHQASVIYIQVVSHEILEKIVELDHPHKMWTLLKTEFYRDTAFALVSQIMTLVSLPSQYEPSQPISLFLQSFEQEWLRLSNLAKSSKDSYRKSFHTFLCEDKAKRDFLLGFLVRHHPNVVDNLSTKDQLTFAEVKQRLLDLDHDQKDSSSASQTALTTSQPRRSNNKKKSSSSSNPSNKTKECTWCAKHSPGSQLGHTWNQCFKLKKYNEEQKENGKGKRKDKETALIANEDNDKVRSKSFYFDTGATSHMCPFPERFESLTVCTGAVKSSSKDFMAIKGKGTVMMDCVLSDGTISSFKVSNVLFVPELERPLLSWRKIMEKGYSMVGKGDFISIVKENKVLFEASFDGSLFKVSEINDTALLTFDFWHSALGHLAPSTIQKARDLYTNASIIPPIPDNFHCHECSLAKSTHHTPTSSYSKAERKLELIHSDLCGPFQVHSYGRSLYYISFIDDFTRVTWVRFLKYKSEASQAIEDFVTEMITQHELPVKRFRTNNGGEYVNEKLRKYFLTKGIVHNLTPAYSPESNSVAERFNRTMGEAVRAMVIPLKDPKLWADAVSTFVYLKNRQPHKAVPTTPYEAFHGTKPSIHHLQPFGRDCYVHIPKAKRPAGSKLSPRAIKGIFTGYTNVEHHYRVWIPAEKRSVISADVFFPPHISEGATPVPTQAKLISQPLLPSESSSTPSSSDISYNFNKESFPSEDMWTAWMERNPEQTVQWYNKGHTIVRNLVHKAYVKGKRDGFLGPEYFTVESTENIPSSSSSSSSNDSSLYRPPPARTNIPIKQENPQQLPLDESIHSFKSSDYPHYSQTPSSPPPPPPSNEPYRTRAGRIVRPPGEWWKVQPQQQTLPADEPPAEVPQAPPSLDDNVMDLGQSDESTLLSILDVSEPQSYKAAKSHPDWPQWKLAINEELKSLEENKVWDIVDKPNRKIVDCRWVFKVKGNAKGEIERYKARLVAKGFSQVMGQDYDEIFSPVVRFDSLRLLLAISASKGWRVKQLDVKTAFLYGILKEEVYMQLPEGSRLEGKVARLRRCIYGLKQSPREWYFRLVEYLIPYGFVVTAFDPCVMIHDSGNLIIAIYVDDLTLFGPDGDLTESTLSLLKAEFKVNDMGLLHYLLGIQIDYTNAGITLSQSAFIDKILNRFSMQDCNPVHTPIDANHRLMATSDQDDKADATAY